MQRLEVSGAGRPIYGSLGVKRLSPSASPLSSMPSVKKTKLHVGMNITDVEETGAVCIIIPSDDGGAECSVDTVG